MGLYPVIMCGGAGTRLWPESRPARPKQFIPLSGNRSLFQDAAMRVACLAEPGGQLIVLGGAGHREAILTQLAELDLTAQILLEPEARDSAAAMAAAAAWTARQDPDGINVFVASDHHIPDHAAFRTAVLEAAQAARAGRVVTLGILPDRPSPAFGYIAPSGPGLSSVKAFVEKPDVETAERYIAAGYLWNSGNFIVAATTLLEELRSQAPAVAEAATSALPRAEAGSIAMLLPVFSTAPKISIDYAVMEKTRRASVLPVDFAWSDLGAWDAVAATGEGDLGAILFEDADGCMARAPEGVMVAAIGVRNLAIIAERDAVLVCDMSRSQDVRKIVERLRTASPQHLDFETAPPEGLIAGGERLAAWLRLRALPLWSAVGQAETGAFAELLTLDGRFIPSARRARVQARQILVFAEAGRQGWAGPWRRKVRGGLACLEAQYLDGDGLMRTRLDDDGRVLDPAVTPYDQAFHVLARAAAARAGIGGDHAAIAVRVREALSGPMLDTVGVSGGLVSEGGALPLPANAHMHLLEACLAWEEANLEAGGGDPGWAQLADRIVDLALTRLIDPEAGYLRELFAADGSPAPGEQGRLVEPGHQFEWAWLLARHGRARGQAATITAARRLYACGKLGVGARRRVAVDALNDEAVIVSRRARLWPQTAWMKAALVLAELAQGDERATLLDSAAAAQRALWRYLTPDGLWRDKLLENGTFIDEPAPASAFYHILGAHLQLGATAERLGLDTRRLDLS